MKNWMLFGLLIPLGGCAWQHCEYGPGTPPPDDSCHAGQLLYQHDMLQAKMLISQANPDNYELAQAMLNRAARTDASGEAEFYQAVLLIRSQGDHDQAIALLERAASRHHPLAIALLARQLADTAPGQAAYWQEQYAGLDVARSGYPSFEQAQEVIAGLVNGQRPD